MQGLDELLVEDLRHRRAHRPGDEAHRDYREGDDRQHQVAQVLGVPFPCGRSAWPHPERRQHVHLDREDDDEDEAEPVVRHADPGDRERGRGLVDPPSLEVAGDPAEDRPQGEPEQGSPDGEDEGVGHGDAKLGHDLAAARDGDPEIAHQHPPEPGHVLDRKRLVESVRLLEVLHHLFRRVGRHHRAQRVAGGHVHQGEDEDRHPESDRNDVENPADDVVEHVAGRAAGRAGPRAAARPS